MMLVDEVKRKIGVALPGAVVEVFDFSDQHLDHGSPGAHLEVVVVFEGFKGLSLVEQHRKIYDIFDDEFKNKKIHALRIKTRVV